MNKTACTQLSPLRLFFRYVPRLSLTPCTKVQYLLPRGSLHEILGLLWYSKLLGLLPCFFPSFVISVPPPSYFNTTKQDEMIFSRTAISSAPADFAPLSLFDQAARVDSSTCLWLDVCEDISFPLISLFVLRLSYRIA